MRALQGSTLLVLGCRSRCDGRIHKNELNIMKESNQTPQWLQLFWPGSHQAGCNGAGSPRDLNPRPGLYWQSGPGLICQ